MRVQARCLTLTDLLAPIEQGPVARQECMVFSVNGEDPVASLTRSELTRKALAVAYRLQHEVAPGSRALVSFPTSPEFFSSFFGCLYAGVIAVPVQSARTQQSLGRVEAIALECGAEVFLTSSKTVERIEALDPSFWQRTGMKPITVDNIDPAEAKTVAMHLSDGYGPAYLQFTSGSTGTPRGVMVSHANVFSNLDVIDERAGRPRGSAAVSWLPLYHDMGLVSAMYALYADLKLVLLSPAHFVKQPWRWLQAISKHRAVYSGGPNFAYELCNGAEAPPDSAPLDLSSWQFAFCGAEMVRPATMRRFAQSFERFGFRPQALSPSYGLAEGTLIVAGVPYKEKGDIRMLESACLSGGPVIAVAPDSSQPSTEISECGMPGTGHTLRIVDPDRGHVLPDGHVGEIWVSGPSKALGYWQRSDETRATFEAQLPGDHATYLRTGDLGFMQAGRLYVTGRIKELIIVRGRNYHPHEIEEAVRHAHSALTSTAAFAVTTDKEEALIIVSELRRGSWRRLVMADLLNAIQDELVRRLDVRADFIGLVKPGAIPRTTSGKVQRLHCREQYRANALEFLAVWPPKSEPQAEPIPPIPPQLERSAQQSMRSNIEDWMVQWLSFRLRIPVDRIDRRQPLSAYGLDSLTAVQFSQSIEEWLDVPVPETLAWSYPTIEELSTFLAQAVKKSTPEVTAEQRKESQSQVDLAIQWVERLSDSEVEHLFSRRLIKE